MFEAGEEIEVDGDRENSDDCGTAWLTGTVMKVIDKTTFTVEYRKFQEDGSSNLLTEILDERYIRPVPPRTPKSKVFAVHEEIEVRHCGGWIVGVVLQAVDGLTYIVKMKYGKGEEMELNRTDMRIRHNWIKGQWKCANKCARRVPTMKSHNMGESSSHAQEQSLLEHRLSEGSGSSMPESQIPPNVQTEILSQGSITFRHDPQCPNVHTDIPSMPEAQVPSDVQTDILSPGSITIQHGPISPNVHTNILLPESPVAPGNPEGLIPPNVASLAAKPIERVPRHAPPSTQFEPPRANSCSEHMTQHGERSGEKSIAIPNAQLSTSVQTNILSPESPVVPGNPEELMLSSSASSTTAPIKRSSLNNNHGRASLPTKTLNPTSSSPGLKRKMGEGVYYEGHVGALRPCKQKKEGDTSEQPCLKIDPRTTAVEIKHPDAGKGSASLHIESTMGNESEKMAHQSDPAHTRSTVKRIPFVKSSFLWKSIESMEIFDIMPQDPCFRQLEELSEEIREGMAIGLMVTFANLASRVEKLCINDSYETFKERLEALVPLEENGFDVRLVRSRIEELLEIKNYQRQSKNKKTALEEQMLGKEYEESRLDTLNCALDKTITEVERHLASLREERDSVNSQRMTSRLEMAKLQKDAQAAEEAYLSAERRFATILASPW